MLPHRLLLDRSRSTMTFSCSLIRRFSAPNVPRLQGMAPPAARATGRRAGRVITQNSVLSWSPKRAAATVCSSHQRARTTREARRSLGPGRLPPLPQTTGLGCPRAFNRTPAWSLTRSQRTQREGTERARVRSSRHGQGEESPCLVPPAWCVLRTVSGIWGWRRQAAAGEGVCLQRRCKALEGVYQENTSCCFNGTEHVRSSWAHRGRSQRRLSGLTCSFPPPRQWEKVRLLVRTTRNLRCERNLVACAFPVRSTRLCDHGLATAAVPRLHAQDEEDDSAAGKHARFKQVRSRRGRELQPRCTPRLAPPSFSLRLNLCLLTNAGQNSAEAIRSSHNGRSNLERALEVHLCDHHGHVHSFRYHHGGVVHGSDRRHRATCAPATLEPGYVSGRENVDLGVLLSSCNVRHCDGIRAQLKSLRRISTSPLPALSAVRSAGQLVTEVQAALVDAITIDTMRRFPEALPTFNIRDATVRAALRPLTFVKVLTIQSSLMHDFLLNSCTRVLSAGGAL